MEFFKTRKAASAVLAAVILVFTLVGMHLSLARLSKKTTAMFYDGVYLKSEGYTSASIETHLEKRLDASLGLVTVAANYPALAAETDALRTARSALSSAGTISAKYAANTQLETAWKTLWSAMDGAGLSDSDKSNAADYAKTLNSAQNAIAANQYNSKVSEYETDVLGRFPVSAVKGLVAPVPPEYFA